MDLIKVKKNNEVFLQIETEPSIEQELSEHFCFYVPGYKFMPAYRNRMWDGKIRLFDLRAKTLYSGLFKYVQEFAKVRDYTLEVDQNSFGTPESTHIADIESLLERVSLSVLWSVCPENCLVVKSSV